MYREPYAAIYFRSKRLGLPMPKLQRLMKLLKSIAFKKNLVKGVELEELVGLWDFCFDFGLVEQKEEDAVPVLTKLGWGIFLKASYNAKVYLDGTIEVIVKGLK